MTSTRSTLAVEQPGELRDDLPRARMQARLVGRHEQHASRTGVRDLACEIAHERGELVERDLGSRAADGEERPSGGRRHARRIGADAARPASRGDGPRRAAS